MSKTKKGTLGTFEGREVEVTAVREDGTLDLCGTAANVGHNASGIQAVNPNPWFRESVPADQFVAVETK